MKDDILLQVHKPAQYIGQEWNVSRKEFSACDTKFALCFPDLYEVGMSNVGVRLLYGVINAIPNVCCERVFAPEADMERLLRTTGSHLLTLESRRKLAEFDLVGFSLSHELTYTNVLNVLELGHIPLQASLRGAEYPLIIAGGPATLNPEPMHEFFDCFVCGEAEEAVREIIDLYRKHKEKFRHSQISKQDLLFLFSQIEGVYVPSLYEVAYTDEGPIARFNPALGGVPPKVKKRTVKDFDSAYFPVSWLLPYIQIVNDRIILEIMRGCPNRCRFCQARAYYYPFRCRDIAKVLEIALDSYNRTGYEEISLGGLSVSDYPQIEKLISGLLALFKDKAVGVSLPSIKPKKMVGELSTLISTVKKTGLTFAPEAGSARLREVLGKDFRLEDFFEALAQAYRAGYQHVKLYFMIGIPYETQEDLKAMIELANQVSELRRKAGAGPAAVNMSINTLIPKPHTPFQWSRMISRDEIKEKQSFIRSIAKNRRFKISFHNCDMTFLEGILSRGDRRLSRVIYSAFKNGARMDAWSNHFSLEIWLKAFKENNLAPEFYLQEKSCAEILPWDFLDTGLSKDVLIREANHTKVLI